MEQMPIDPEKNKGSHNIHEASLSLHSRQGRKGKSCDGVMRTHG